MEFLYETSLENVEGVFEAFKKYTGKMYKNKTPSYNSFKQIYKHYMMCVLTPKYIDYIDKNDNEIKQTVKLFNVARSNVITELITKAKFENMKLFNVLSWVYAAKKIVMIEAHRADTHYCYITSEKIEESYSPVLHIYVPEINTPRVVAVTSQYKHLIYCFYVYVHIEDEIQVKGREWL